MKNIRRPTPTISPEELREKFAVMKKKADEQALTENYGVARAATSYTVVFPRRAEVPRKVAKICRTAMTIARRDRVEPRQRVYDACKIVDPDWEYDERDIMEIVGRL